jgi:tetratricopeptide (TPR) repeat protein
MARKSHATGDALEEIQGAADRLGDWIERNWIAVTIAVVVLLAAAGGAQYMMSAAARTEGEASEALASLRAAYLDAMGAAPGALEAPELANPAAGEEIRQSFAKRFAALADAHAGTVSGTLARLEVGNLLSESGDLDGALKAWQRALAEAPRRDALRGMLYQRIAAAYENAGRWQDAAAQHEAAAALPAYPLRDWALADAARCLAEAGDRTRALALYEQLEARAPNLRLPSHQRAQIAALRAAAEAS